MTIIAFTPVETATPMFQAQVTLDGSPYLLQVNLQQYSQRFYMMLTDGNGNVAWNGAFLGSPADFDIPLAAGVFETSTIIYRESTGNIEITP